MRQEKNKVKFAINVNEWQQRMILAMLANLCYVEITPEQAAEGWENAPVNRLAEMGEYRITPELKLAEAKALIVASGYHYEAGRSHVDADFLDFLQQIKDGADE
jgi:hypothetical protein